MTKKMKTTIGVSAVFFILAIAAVAFAHGPRGGGRMMGYGGPMMGSGCGYGPRGWGAWGDLSDETRAQIAATREAFHKETRQLRDEIDDARIDLRDEMARENPDEAKVLNLRKRLSELEAEFDQKAVSHRLQMRKLLPEDFRGQGYGRGYGRGPGGCW